MFGKFNLIQLTPKKTGLKRVYGRQGDPRAEETSVQFRACYITVASRNRLLPSIQLIYRTVAVPPRSWAPISSVHAVHDCWLQTSASSLKSAMDHKIARCSAPSRGELALSLSGDNEQNLKHLFPHILHSQGQPINCNRSSPR